MISETERKKMLAVPLCGPRVVKRLESIGVTTLLDLKGKDPYKLMAQINFVAGRIIWRPPMAIIALRNLITAASADTNTNTQQQE